MPLVEFPGRGPVSLPPQFTEFRPHQIDAVNEILDAFDAGSQVVLLDAPTGAGKTIIGRTVSILHPKAEQTMYVCTTKGLQDQFLHDFPDAKVIKGKANYPTLGFPGMFGKGIDCGGCSIRPVVDAPEGCQGCLDFWEATYSHTGVTWSHCDFCHPVKNCPYRVAKSEAMASELAVANTAYFLSEANNVGFFSDRDLLIVDEADTIEQLLMSFMSVELSRSRLRQIGVDQPRFKSVVESWVPWSEAALVAMAGRVQQASQGLRGLEGVQLAKATKERDRLNQILSNLARFNVQLKDDADNWVYMGEGGGASFKPVEVQAFGHPLLFDHAENTLMMSATLISSNSLMSFLGFEGRWTEVKVNSNFDPERRPVWITPAANMTFKEKETEWPKMVEAVSAVLDRHTDVRVLVHTVSYEFTNFLKEGLSARHGRRLLSYRNAKEREGVLEEFRTSDAGVVLAPSFDRGVDLPDDDARVIVVTKVPFPFLGDKQINQRLFGTGLAGRTWYSMETIRSLVQMTGRGMRHKNDWCITYVLDRQFKSNVWKSRELIPKWWKDSMKWGPPTAGGAEAITRAEVPRRLG